MREITEERDIQERMRLCAGFHDSCIVSAGYSSGAFVDESNGMGNGEPLEHTLELVLHSQLCRPIKLLFKGVRKFSVIGWRDNYFCDIFGAYLAFHSDLLGRCRDDRLIVWSDSESFDPSLYAEDSLLSSRGSTYVVAEKLFWEINYKAGEK